MPETASADVVRNAILAQNAGDDDAMLASMHPEVVWKSDTSGTLRGRDALRELLADARQQIGDVRITLHELHERPDAVLVIGTVSAENGLNMPRAWIWQLSGGLAVRVDSYPGRVEALHAWEQLTD